MGWSSVWKMNSCNTWIYPCNTWVESMYYMGYPVTFTDERRTMIADLLSKTDYELARNLITATPPLGTTHTPDQRKEVQTSQRYEWECSAEQLTRDTLTSIKRKRAGISPWMCLCLGSSLKTCNAPKMKHAPSGSQQARWDLQ